jgi:chromatin segregation and condensation protein Rec8/ScpA/Scc1 (kleisin family)
LDDKKYFILKSFDGDGTLTFSRLLSSCKDKQEIIITFLSVLDLMRLLEIVIYQNNLFGDIEIHRLEKN